MPETTPTNDIEQGLTRLAMLEFLTGQPGPWNGNPTSPARWARYRGHQINRDAREFKILVALSFDDANGEASRIFHDIDMVGGIDPTVQALRVLAEWDQLIDLLDEPEVVVRAESDILGPFRTVEGVRLATLDEAGAYATRLEGILRHVHDLVKRGASLDEIDAGLHAARSANEQIARDERVRHEVDLEVDGKAIARAEEVDTDA